MRFVPDGPDVPNDLIRKWREGKVLFLAGAGVSVPSQLPLFDGLALGVYEVLNDSLFSILKDARAIVHPEARKQFLKAAELSELHPVLLTPA
jgi:NAD-dependent SIR2 family protein deacetylase